MAEQLHTFLVTPTPPFALEPALAFLRSSPSAIVEEVADGRYRRAIRLGDQQALLTVWSTGTLKQPELTLQVQGEGLDAQTAAEAIPLVRRLFTTDPDPAPFLALAAQEPVLAALVATYPGFRPVQIADPFEALLWAIIGQQVNVTFAKRQKLTLLELCGHPCELAGRPWPLAPSPADLAALDPALLTARQFSRQKASYLIGVGQAVCGGQLDLHALREMPEPEALAHLIACRGIGRWTAEYLLMRALGARDSLPAADVGLRKMLGQALGLGRNATEAEVRSHAQAWAGWRAWAAFYLWLHAQLTEANIT